MKNVRNTTRQLHFNNENDTFCKKEINIFSWYSGISTEFLPLTQLKLIDQVSIKVIYYIVLLNLQSIKKYLESDGKLVLKYSKRCADIELTSSLAFFIDFGYFKMGISSILYLT